jgi:hypothetical protein
MVSDERFWQIIDEARRGRGTSDERLSSIRSQLMGQDPASLAEFRAVGIAWWVALARRDLWAAAETLMGGCGEDSFTDFRQWLLLQGRAAIEQVVQNPDVLADWTFTESPRVEGLVSIPEEVAGAELPEISCDPDVSDWPTDRIADYDWTDRECARLFPRLFKKPSLQELSLRPSPWEAACRSAAEGDALPYSRDASFSLNARLSHPRYGVGVVTGVRGDRIDVTFPDDQVRVFLHKPR